MNIIKIMCEEKDCKDCHGPYDVSEVRDSTVEEKEESAEDTPKYSLKNVIEVAGVLAITMPETAEERRARQATIEQAARARLHGVEMPKRLDFNAKKLHHEYLCFKTLAKKVLDCYEGLEDSIKVNKVLMWMGPEACVKH